MSRAKTLLLLFAVVLAACSSAESNEFSAPDTDDAVTATDEEVTPENAPTPEVETAGVEDSIADEPTEAESDQQSAGSADSGAAAPAPLEAFDQNTEPQEDTGGTAWISRVNMTAESIEVTWASTDNAVEYQIHRVPLSPAPPGVEVLTAENLIHTATENGRVVDDTVEAGTQYWYGVRSLSASGDILAHAWHRADAVTDVDPPEAPGVSATAQDGGVLVEWSVPDEGYELHAYRVLRGVDGAEPELLATTWTLDQRSFIDDDPPASEEVVYQVVALDFHWNVSSPGEVGFSGS